jgi:hypothetical protein
MKCGALRAPESMKKDRSTKRAIHPRRTNVAEQAKRASRTLGAYRPFGGGSQIREA